VFCPVVSVDDHVLEPPTVFDALAETATRPRAAFRRAEGGRHPYWIIDDTKVPDSVLQRLRGAGEAGLASQRR
jgi:hypothetical protein